MRTLQKLDDARASYRQDARPAHDEFLTLLSHELRTPLGAILAASDLLEAAEPGSADAAEARAVIARQARELKWMLDELMHAGRAMGGAPLTLPLPAEYNLSGQIHLATHKHEGG